MSFNATVITIFISSPGDVPEDRKLIIRTINGWNQRNGGSRKVFFQALTWEQLVAPDRGRSGQDVIDDQIGNTYDIYLGLMWSRFGSATTKADSGTEDEFDQAIARHDSDGGLTISFLFKNSPIPQDMLDGLQFDKVQKFKKKVAEFGCLYREFNDDASLVDAVNLILDRFANASTPESGNGGPQKVKDDRDGSTSINIGGNEKDNAACDIEENEFELGLLDYNEILSTEGSNFTALMEEWNSRLSIAGQAAKEATDELNSISRFGEIEPTAAKKIINRVANYTNEFVDWGDENIQLIDKSMEVFAEAFSGLAIVSVDFDTSDAEIESGIKAGEELIDTIDETNVSLEGLSKSALSVPRITKEMIQANKRLADLLSRMIEKNKTFAVNVGISVDELKSRQGAK